MSKRKGLLLLLGLLLAVILCNTKVHANTEPKSFTIQYNGINITRYENYVVIYTYDKRTSDNKSGANQWGYEVSVDKDGIVVEMGVNVTFAPDGFIVSVHGQENINKIRDNVNIGDEVTYDTNTKTITFTFSILGSIRNLEKEIISLKNTKIELDLGAYDVDIEAINNDLNTLNNRYNELKQLGEEIKSLPIGSSERNAKLAVAEQEYAEAMSLLDEVSLKMIVPLKLEARGIWHRANVFNSEISLDKLRSNIEEFKSAGINQIYVETLWWGHSIGQSDLVDYHPNVRYSYGEYPDYLTAFIDLAHKAGIEVHAWTETFFHNQNHNHYPKWLKNNPSWLNLDFYGRYMQTGKGTEDGFVFIDPANEEVRQFLINYYVELANKFDLDGIQLDYIRYPAESSLETSSGYTPVAMNKFMERYNLSGDLKQLLIEEKSQGKKELYQKWCEFRAEQVTIFVEEVVKAIREVKPDMKISIAVGPDYQHALKDLMQDWKTWVEKGWIDIIAPMAYTFDTDYVKTVVNSMNDISNGLTYNYTGIGAYMEGPTLLYTNQILISRAADGLGSVIFASQNLLGKEEMKTALSKGLNKITAISPNADLDKILDAMFTYIIDKANRIYITKGLMTEEQKGALTEEFTRIKNMKMHNAGDYYLIQQEITKLNNNIHQYVRSVGAQRIKEDLYALIDNIDLKITRYLINYGYWDPTTGERPDPLTIEYPVIDVPVDENEEDKPGKNYDTLLYIIIGVASLGIIGTSVFVFMRRKR